MLNDSFKMQYTTIPFATYARNYKKNRRAAGLSSLSHRHKEMEILVVRDGGAKFYIDTEEYQVSKGDLVVITPYLLHRAEFLEDTDFKHYCICFDLSLLYDGELKEKLLRGEIGILPKIEHQQKYAEELFGYIVKAYQLHKTQSPGWELGVVGNLSLFFGQLKECGLLQEKEAEKKKDFCYRVIDYIEKNYPQPITSAGVAEHFYMSNSYFCRKFKEQMGHCFKTYLGMYRVAKSKVLLKAGEMPISEIALSVGFCSFSYYGKVFRELTGITPSEYRRQAQQKG
ncbi:MAG: helix-turn-helix domain-containing protein [Clostridia bacterium]|nr:helix-turn-helix domain-containing protein [Clostridia bacterium]